MARYAARNPHTGFRNATFLGCTTENHPTDDHRHRSQEGLIRYFPDPRPTGNGAARNQFTRLDFPWKIEDRYALRNYFSVRLPDSTNRLKDTVRIGTGRESGRTGPETDRTRTG
jgi:hypothetical protein